MGEHHRVTEQGKHLGALTSKMHDKGIQILAAEGLNNLDLPTVRKEMCASCACRAGTVPNGCAQTQLDLIKAAVDGKPFLCHAPMDGKMCAGWLAVRAFHAQFPAQPLIDMAKNWEYSPPDNAEQSTQSMKDE
jgi:hypothetical protein